MSASAPPVRFALSALAALSALSALSALFALGTSGCASTDEPPVGAWPASAAEPAPAPHSTTGAWRARYDLELDGAPWKVGQDVAAFGATTDGGFVAVSPTVTPRGLVGLATDGAGAVRSAWGFRFDAAVWAPMDYPTVSRGAVLAVASEYDSNHPGPHALTILEIAPDGSLRKNHRIDTGVYNRFPMAFRTEDGGTLVVAGSLLVKLAADGAPVWSRVYSAAGHDEILAGEPLEVADGYVVAFRDLPLAVPFVPALMLAHLSSAGEITWARKIAVRKDAVHSPASFLVGDDGRILTCVALGTGTPGALLSLAPNGEEGWAREFELSLHGVYERGPYGHGNPGYLLRSPDGFRCGVRADRGASAGNRLEGVALELKTDGTFVRATRDLGRFAATLPDGGAVVLREGLGGPWFRLDHPVQADACAPPLQGSIAPPKPVDSAPLTITSAARTVTKLAPIAPQPLAITAKTTPEQCW